MPDPTPATLAERAEKIVMETSCPVHWKPEGHVDVPATIQGHSALVWSRLLPALRDADAELARLREALDFYADESNYVEQTPERGMLDGPIPMERDGGARARAALKGASR